ncbi:MAG: serine protease [Planctomycetota bacterium]
MSRSGILLAAALVASALGAAGQAGAAGPDEAGQYAALLEKKAPMIVTVRAVMKTEINFGGQGQNQESREEIAGVVVDESGLVMVSYDSFKSSDEGSGSFQLKRTPQEIKVIFEREEKEYDADLVATDKNVNLAFLKVRDLEGRELSVARFDESADVEVGQKVAAVGRLKKGYDYAPHVRSAVVSGRIKKPRKALILDGGVTTEGLPVYTMDGAMVGVLTTLETGVGEEDGSSLGFLSMMGGGGGQSFVLPAKVIGKLVEQAKKQADEVAAEKAEEEKEPSRKEGSDSEEDG